MSEKEVKGKVVEGEEPKREGGGCCGGSPPPPPDPLKFHLKAWDNTCGRNLDLDRLQVGASSESEDDPELEEVRARYMTDAQLREPGGPLEKVEALEADDMKDTKSGDAQLEMLQKAAEEALEQGATVDDLFNIMVWGAGTLGK